jgi:HSP20 family protein
MSVFFPRFHEFSPLFRLSDELDRAIRAQASSQPLRSFQPRFDVRETDETYELLGELPGLDAKDVNIEWADDGRLTISGQLDRRSKVSSEGSESSESSDATDATDASDAGFVDVASEESSEHYKQPTVEDEGAEGEASTSAEPESSATKQSEAAKPAADQTKYWYSERSYGSFRRTFKFSQRVDHEAVSAKLKNGVLSIVVPKAKAREPRRISIN